MILFLNALLANRKGKVTEKEEVYVSFCILSILMVCGGFLGGEGAYICAVQGALLYSIKLCSVFNVEAKLLKDF